MYIDCIIVNWNSGSQLHECLESINYFGSGLVAKIIVVDNGSVDGSESHAEDYSNVSLIRTGSNLGFGKACNIGSQVAHSDYLLFLNPDAALCEDALRKVVAYMQDPTNATVGICGVKLLNIFGMVSRGCARFPTPSNFVVHAVGLHRLFPHLSHFIAEWGHDQTRVVDHVIGAFYFVRRSIFVSLNGFDENFFVYLEDLDFSYRARQAGWNTIYLADAKAFHAGGGTSKQVKATRLFYSLRSRMLYAFKHFSIAGSIIVFVVTMFVEPLSRSIGAINNLTWAGLKDTWLAYGMLWRWLPQWIRNQFTN